MIFLRWTSLHLAVTLSLHYISLPVRSLLIVIGHRWKHIYSTQVNIPIPFLQSSLSHTRSLPFYNFLAFCLLCCHGNKLCGGYDAAHITPIELSSPEERGKQKRQRQMGDEGLARMFAGVCLIGNDCKLYCNLAPSLVDAKPGHHLQISV